MNIPDGLRDIMGKIEAMSKDTRKVVKTVFATETEKTLFDEINKVKQEILDKKDYEDHLQKRVWADVEDRLRHYDSMKYDFGLGVIEILESPLQTFERERSEGNSKGEWRDE